MVNGPQFLKVGLPSVILDPSLLEGSVRNETVLCNHSSVCIINQGFISVVDKADFYC